MKAPTHSVPYEVIQYDQSAVDPICCLGDFYQNIGLTERIKAGEVTNVDQVWMNKDECESLQDYMRKNIPKSKKHKHLKGKALDTAIAMDWLNYSPVAIPYVPKGELWIFALDDRTKAMEEYREWYRSQEDEAKIKGIKV